MKTKTKKENRIALEEDLLKTSRVPQKFWGNVDSFKSGDTALKLMRKYLKAFDTGDREGHSLCIYGASGSQKTMLACYAAHNVLAIGASVLYVTSSELTDTLVDRKESMISYQDLFKADLLIIDNAENLSSQFAKESILRVLRRRLDEGLYYCLVTRHTPSDFAEVFGADLAELLTRSAVMIETTLNDAIWEEKFNVKEFLEKV